MLQYKTAALEIKDVGEKGEIKGLVSTYNYVDRGGDSVVPGAFTKSLQAMDRSGRTVKMLWQHNPSQPIGVWESFTDTKKGLMGYGRILNEVAAGAETLALLKAGAIDGLSIGFRTVDSAYEAVKGESIRLLKELDLWEVSLVTFPMNTEATVKDAMRLNDLRDVERLLRDAGVPGGFAKLVAKYGYEGAVKCLQDEHRDDALELAEARAAKAALLTKLKGLKETLNA